MLMNSEKSVKGFVLVTLVSIACMERVYCFLATL